MHGAPGAPASVEASPASAPVSASAGASPPMMQLGTQRHVPASQEQFSAPHALVVVGYPHPAPRGSSAAKGAQTLPVWGKSVGKAPARSRSGTGSSTCSPRCLPDRVRGRACRAERAAGWSAHPDAAAIDHAVAAALRLLRLRYGRARPVVGRGVPIDEIGTSAPGARERWGHQDERQYEAAWHAATLRRMCAQRGRVFRWETRAGVVPRCAGTGIDKSASRGATRQYRARSPGVRAGRQGRFGPHHARRRRRWLPNRAVMPASRTGWIPRPRRPHRRRW